jgi:hypothetical protein
MTLSWVALSNSSKRFVFGKWQTHAATYAGKHIKQDPQTLEVEMEQHADIHENVRIVRIPTDLRKLGDDAVVASLLGTVGLSEDSGLGPWIRWILCILGLSSGSKQSCEKPTYRPPSVTTAAEPVAAAVVNTAKKATNATKAPEPISTAEEPRRQAAPSQRGGSRDEVRGRDEDVGSSTSNEISGPGPVVAGALTAVVIAAGLKSTYEFISQQYQ